jgi:hypothetical protein
MAKKKPGRFYFRRPCYFFFGAAGVNASVQKTVVWFMLFFIALVIAAGACVFAAALHWSVRT